MRSDHKWLRWHAHVIAHPRAWCISPYAQLDWKSSTMIPHVIVWDCDWAVEHAHALNMYCWFMIPSLGTLSIMQDDNCSFELHSLQHSNISARDCSPLDALTVHSHRCSLNHDMNLHAITCVRDCMQGKCLVALCSQQVRMCARLHAGQMSRDIMLAAS